MGAIWGVMIHRTSAWSGGLTAYRTHGGQVGVTCTTENVHGMMACPSIDRVKEICVTSVLNMSC